MLAGGAVLATTVLGGGGDDDEPEVRVLAGADAPPDPATHTFDVVLRGGRVMDPASGYDHVANVGIDGGTVTQISASDLKSASVIDAAGWSLRPASSTSSATSPTSTASGSRSPTGSRRTSGCTASSSRAADFFAVWGSEALRPPTHYGGAFSDPWTRAQLGIGVDDPATPEQIDQLVAICDEDLATGYMAVDFEPEYTPGVTFDEIKALTQVAKDRNVPATFHARYSDDVSPGTNAEALAEVLKVARDTGARVHVEHIVSTGGTYTMEQSLRTLEEARADGVEVTACTYPYNFWATYLASTRFNDGWEERFHITYDDLAVVGTGERLTAASFPGSRPRTRSRPRTPSRRATCAPRCARRGSCSAATPSSSPATRTIHARPVALHARSAATRASSVCSA